MPMSRDRSAALSIPDLLNPDPGCEASKFSLEYSPGEVLPRIHGWSVLHPWAVGVVCQAVQDLFASLSALQNFVFACSRGRHSSGVDAFAKRFRLSVYTAEPFSRTQPQGSVCRLHGLRHDCYEISAQRFEVRFVAQSCGESLERPGLVVLATVEAPMTKSWIRPRRGLNNAAMVRGEATIASWDSLPIRARNSACNSTTLPT